MENTTKTVTLAELAEHNVKNDLWIAVHGKGTSNLICARQAQK